MSATVTLPMAGAATVPVTPRGSQDGSVDADRLWETISAVEDPELPISLVDLGLVRELDVVDGRVRIGLTYTSLACPCVEIIKDDVRDAVAALPDVTDVEVDDVLEAWSRDDVSPAGLEALRAVAVL
jgi:metal-sulfur cluster biosynthetic enzyme